MFFIRKFSIFLVLYLSVALQCANAETVLVPESALSPDAVHTETAKLIITVIEGVHYRKKTLDDALSSVILDNYLKRLDPQRSFFLAKDIQVFSAQYQYVLDDALQSSNLVPAFDIFKLFRNRLKQRTDKALSMLENDFDFELDDDYMFDRREDDWVENVDELDHIWEKRIKNDLLNLILSNKEEEAAKDVLKKRYQRLYMNTFQLEANDVFELFVNAYTTAIDPHTSYFSPRVSENFDISMRLSLEGIGAVLSNDYDHTLVQKIIPGGPADISNKLHSKDKIIGVGQGNDGEIVDVIGWRLDDVVELIRGPKNTELRLQIIPNKVGSDIATIITLTRDEIKLEESAAQSKLIHLDDVDTKIGVIDIPAFYTDFGAQAKGKKDFRSTSRDVKNLISGLTQQQVNSIIIDLRGNSGGSLLEALLTTGLFIDEGPIVQTRNSAGGISINNDPNADVFYSGLLAVLVDRDSASASEIFAGAIQDYQRGIIIGEPTYGKGTVQTIIDLNKIAKNKSENYGKLKTTIQQFFRVSGSSNQNRGVIPDIIFPTAFHIDDHGERSLEHALPWAEIAEVPYNKINMPIHLYDQVRSFHEQRVNSNKAFELLRQQLELIEKDKANKVISLNKSKRKANREQRLEIIYAIENELRIAQGLTPLSEAEKKLRSEKEVDQFAENDEDEDQPDDILLQESAKILHDLAMLLN